MQNVMRVYVLIMALALVAGYEASGRIRDFLAQQPEESRDHP